MPLFQPEGPEKQRRPKRKEPPSAVLDRSDEGRSRLRTKPPEALSRPGSLFQAEPEEGLQVVKSKPSGSKKQLFDPESESSDGECSRDSDALEDTLSSAALNFGWHKLHEAAKARFAKEVSAAGKQEKPKRHYDNSKRAARAAYERTAGKFKENGLSSERITGVLAMDECLCAAKTCFSQYKEKEVRGFMQEFWELSKTDQDSLFALSVDGKGSVTSSSFLGHSIGFRCLAKLVGVGGRRLKRATTMVPDLRYGKNKSGHDKLACSIDAFLAMLHESVAETLPDRFVRRGRAAHADDPDFDIESDVEDGELTSWLERPGKSVAFQIIHWQDSKKLVKYLPPGNLKELYQHYASSRSLLGLKSSSHPNNYSVAFRNQCAEVLAAVRASYGASYQESLDYLDGLSRNRFFVRAALQPLPWHSADSQAPGVGDPVYRLHPSVVASLAPSVPLRAAFGGARHV